MQLLSQCHNAEVIGHPYSPSGDPTRCTVCGEETGTYFKYPIDLFVQLDSFEKIRVEAKKEVYREWLEHFDNHDAVFELCVNEFLSRAKKELGIDNIGTPHTGPQKGKQVDLDTGEEVNK